MNPDYSPADDVKPISSEEPEIGDEITGLPRLHTWRRVYGFVVVVFIVYVVLLTLLSREFS